MNKKTISLVITILVMAILSSIFLLGSGVNISTAPGTIGLSIGRAQSDTLSDWTIKFNPSGTQVDDDGTVWIRLDFYPSPESKSYAKQYVYVVDETSREYLEGIPPKDKLEYSKWLQNLPHIWRLNPAISHFVRISPTMGVNELTSFIEQKFSADVIATIDNALDSADSAHELHTYMADKQISITTKSTNPDKAQVIYNVNTTLATLNVKGLGNGIGESLTPQSIDMGSGAADYDNSTSDGYTYFDKNNPANATGTLDTFEFWFTVSCSSGKAGSSYLTSGTTYKTRASYDTGGIASGSKQTQTGKSIAVTSGDFMVFYFSGGAIDYNSTGGVDIRYASGEYADANDQTTTDSDGTQKLAVYATGTESGGTPSLTNSPASLNLGTVFPDGRTVYAKGNAPGNPVESGNCTFTITNNGSITENVTISMTNLTGGTTWTVTSSTPGANTFRITAYYQGQNPASGKVLTTSAQTFYNGLTSSSTIKWDFKFEMPTSSTDSTSKSGTLQLTAISP
jgi:hypothetical protein